jgi:hypothetical protein
MYKWASSGENNFGLGTMGRNGGHSDPPARILIVINSSGLSPLTVLAVNRVLPRPSSPILFVKTDHTPARGDSRSGGFVQNISCVLELGRYENDLYEGTPHSRVELASSEHFCLHSNFF